LSQKLAGLKPGVHAIHIHEKSDCSAVGSSAGVTLNPNLKKHVEKWGVGEYHKGDIGNLTVDANGNEHLNPDEWKTLVLRSNKRYL
jgi:Cu-Zn family superoxide dismutase